MAKAQTVGVCDQDIKKGKEIVRCGGRIRQKMSRPTDMRLAGQEFMGHNADVVDHVCESCDHSYGAGFVLNQAFKNEFAPRKVVRK